MWPLYLLLALSMGARASERWMRNDIAAHLKDPANGIKTFIPNTDVFRWLGYMNKTALSRYIAYYVRLHQDQFRRPKLAEGWSYHEQELAIMHRLEVYGLTLAFYPSQGDNHCMYHTIANSWRENGLTKEILLGLLNTKLSPAVYNAVKHMKTQGDQYYTHEDLQRIAYVYHISVDPTVPQSLAQMDVDAFRYHLFIVQEGRQKIHAAGSALDLAPQYMNLEPVEVFRQLDSGADPRKVALDYYNTFTEVHKEKLGDDVDMSALEKVFQCRLLNFCITSAGLSSNNSSPNDKYHFVTMLYHKAGLIDMYQSSPTSGSRSGYRPRSTLLNVDIPLGMGIMISDDSMNSPVRGAI